MRYPGREEETGDPEISTRIAQYEMAYRMQMSIPEVADIAKEPERVRQGYNVVADRIETIGLVYLWPEGN